MKKYLVGGAVRDKLLGLEPTDRDWVLVGATPENVLSLVAEGYSQVGADFPVFLHPKTGEEYALARVERKTGVGYRGFDVQADASVTLEEDLIRRDLTINSMAMDEDGSLIDPHHGLVDLRNYVLRHTSPAFAEDPLRILRLARFAARFPKFRIAPETMKLCRKISASGELNSLSPERIWTELEKGFTESTPVKFMKVLNDTRALQNCSLLKTLFGAELSEAQLSECTALQGIDLGSRFAVGVAVVALKNISERELVEAQSGGMSNRVVQCYKNVQLITFSKYCIGDLMRVMKISGALREGPCFKDMVKACTIMELVGDTRLLFQPRQLLLARSLMKDVSSHQFENLSGKELGDALHEKRIKSIQLAMEIPDVDRRKSRI